MFVHTRLAILDLSSAGAQPMGFSPGLGSARDPAASCESRYLLVYNGEIYNYRELKEELSASGEVFFGHSDAEVLLRLLAQIGTAAIPKLAGMFAFAFLDRETGKLILARDGFGIKPLYYSRSSDGIAFASEVKTLSTILATVTIDEAAIRDFLLWGSFAETATDKTEIRQLPAGSWMQWDGENCHIHRWYDMGSFRITTSRNPTECIRVALAETMQRHLVADVPVGIFLSGGIDSTCILALARKVLGRDADIRTFSIGFADPSYDESSLARRTAEHFGTQHIEWRITADEVREEIHGYLSSMDLPTTDGFNTWCVSKLAAREGMKVVLSGLGGDELFAGYGSFTQVPRFIKMHRWLGPIRKLVATVLRFTGTGSRWQRLAEYLSRQNSGLAAYHVQRGIFTIPEARRLTKLICGSDPGDPDWSLDDAPANPEELVGYLELTRYMRNQLLRDSDIFSMAHGLELRVPFVDTRLYETLSRIPVDLRLRPGKQLLLEAFPEIPEWIRNQPKRGFRFPFEEWMQSGFGDVLMIADSNTTVPLVTWYRRWALAVLLKSQVANLQS